MNKYSCGQRDQKCIGYSGFLRPPTWKRLGELNELRSASLTAPTGRCSRAARSICAGQSGRSYLAMQWGFQIKITGEMRRYSREGKRGLERWVVFGQAGGQPIQYHRTTWQSLRMASFWTVRWLSGFKLPPASYLVSYVPGRIHSFLSLQTETGLEIDAGSGVYSQSVFLFEIAEV